MKNHACLLGNDEKSFKRWRHRLLNDLTLDSEIEERLGLLHYGHRFFHSISPDVAAEALTIYLNIANQFLDSLILLSRGKATSYGSPILKDKARTVLASHFFANKGPFKDWDFYGMLSFEGALAFAFRNSLEDFLCCARRGIEMKVEFFKWNYWFRDEMLYSNDPGYHEDKVISGFFIDVLYELFGCREESLVRTKLRESGWGPVMLKEAFLRAPWLLLSFELQEDSIAILEHLLKDVGEQYPRSFEGRTQDLPYSALTTRSETLAVLKARLGMPQKKVRGF